MNTNHPATAPVATAKNPATFATITELCAILRDFCEARKALNAFRQSPQGDIMRELPDQFMLADNNMGIALDALFEYVGYYLEDEYLMTDSHE
jgi:hypothetical protein